MNISLTYRLSDRTTAGNLLASILQKYHNEKDIILLAVANGGVVVADAISKKLSIGQLSVVFSKRLRSPHDPEIAIGAILHDGFIFLNPKSHEISNEYLKAEISRQKDYFYWEIL